MSIVMLGLNLGASLVPYLTAIIWNGTGQAYWLPFITFLTMLVPIGLVRLTKVFQKEEIGLTFAVGPVVVLFLLFAFGLVASAGASQRARRQRRSKSNAINWILCGVPKNNREMWRWVWICGAKGML